MYIIMGIFTTAVNISSFYILVEVLDTDYKTATVIAWILSVLFAYITNKIYVFQQKTSDMRSLMRELTAFFSVRLLSLGIDLGMMILLVSQFHTNETLAKILDNVVIVVVNYIASKWLVFKKTTEEGV
ncbi:GtrA family protein [Bacillus atrophaeus]|uniref:GtrA family protein n=1 Tax=Bacillus atrophaeus TaxID=1452 RepID=UPI00227FF51F|nr:GtrA family protein [Bacillus atrophaeus]MCY8496934.1 GtrA family protein [Bacillus atrophaeus]MCY8811789.1 GtrA family protein [Bacillus atrophaeus]MCY8820722.1 GtrA family protein [Bacillus atrophaeus]MCY8828073.1 GtrA family protein [Bacillus atrophaeus]MCY8832127.1 GtrA family protein [Bacillus atrophaeus]